MYQKLKRNKKGFTLAELLIVVAIVAVLVAIAIPAFTASLDRAKAGVWEANARSIHAEAMIAYLDAGSPAGAQTFSGSLGGESYTWTYTPPATGAAATASVKVTNGDDWDADIAEDNSSYTAADGYVFSINSGGTLGTPPTP